jgi:hypothetical protein
MTTPKASGPKFGDRIEGIYASDGNPRKFGTFVSMVHRPHGVMNSGTFFRVTNEKGGFWEWPADSCINHGHGKMVHVGLVERIEAEYAGLNTNPVAMTAAIDAAIRGAI